LSEEKVTSAVDDGTWRTCGIRGIGRFRGGVAQVFPESGNLLLEDLVPAEKLLDFSVAALDSLEIGQLTLQTLNVLLGPGPDSSLGLTIVGPLASQLSWSQSRDASSALPLGRFRRLSG